MTKTVEAIVVFTPSGKRGTFTHGTSVLEAARGLGVDLDSVCGGRGICGRCQINVSTGEFAKFGRLYRRISLANPLLNFDRVLFIKRHKSRVTHMCDGRRARVSLLWSRGIALL